MGSILMPKTAQNSWQQKPVMETFVTTLGPVLGSRGSPELPLPKPMRKGPPSGNSLVGHITY